MRSKSFPQKCGNDIHPVAPHIYMQRKLEYANESKRKFLLEDCCKRAKSDKILLEILSMIDKRLPLPLLKNKKKSRYAGHFHFHLYSSGQKKNLGFKRSTLCSQHFND